jgi:hypothetical protein
MVRERWRDFSKLLGDLSLKGSLFAIRCNCPNQLDVSGTAAFICRGE